MSRRRSGPCITEREDEDMAIRPQDLTLAKNETATEFVVGLVWQLLCSAEPQTPLEDSALRLSKRHVRELAELHDLDQGRLLPEPAPESPMLRTVDEG
jgi:hypothetical protein